MKKFFTRQIIIKSVEQCLKRFPVTVGFTVSLAVFLLVVCWGKDELFTERQTFTINYYLTVGSLLSLSLRLWGEEVKRKRIVYIANAPTPFAPISGRRILVPIAGRLSFLGNRTCPRFRPDGFGIKYLHTSFFP